MADFAKGRSSPETAGLEETKIKGDKDFDDHEGNLATSSRADGFCWPRHQPINGI